MAYIVMVYIVMAELRRIQGWLEGTIAETRREERRQRTEIEVKVWKQNPLT